jgi:hypothetical protein
MGDFFDWPGSWGQAGDGLPHVGRGDRLPELFLESSRCSPRVRLWLPSSCRGSHHSSIVPFLEGPPEIGLASTSPVSRRLLSQRFMIGIDTEKVFATSSLDLPASTAAGTLNLRSFEYGFMPGS